jgi:drug/metabolite transporter (DMT)-like permease
MDEGSKKNLHGIILMVIFSFFDSTAGLFIKLLNWSPFVIAGLRSLLAFAALFIIYKLQGRNVRLSLMSFLGGCIISIMFITFVVATQMTTAANAVMLQYSNPVFILLIAFFFYGQKPGKSDIIVVALVLCGVFLMFQTSYGKGGMIGNALAVLSGAAFAGMFIFNNRIKSETDNISSILLGHLITFIICVPFLFLFPPQISVRNISSIVALGLLQQTIPFILYAKAIRLSTPLVLSLVTMLGPVLNPFLVWIFIGENPSIFTLFGGFLILISVGIWSTMGIRSGSFE